MNFPTVTVEWFEGWAGRDVLVNVTSGDPEPGEYLLIPVDRVVSTRLMRSRPAEVGDGYLVTFQMDRPGSSIGHDDHLVVMPGVPDAE